MSNFAAIGVALFALATVGTAYAADMPVKAPTPLPPVAAPYTWAGCYVGVNGGYGWNDGRSEYSNDPNAPNPDIINGLPDPLGISVLSYFSTPPKAGGSGGLAGGGAGCSIQYQQWVVGLETDFDAAHISGSGTSVISNNGITQFAIGPQVFTSLLDTGTANEEVTLRWLSTIRARAGFAVQDRVMPYVTGGLAIGHIDTQGSITTSSPFPGFPSPGWVGSSSTVKAGGVIGGGIEWGFADRWSAKIEYLWYDLGHISHPLTCSAGAAQALCGAPVGFFATIGDTTSSVYGSIVRIGINYRFGN
jgi:outer membrane immunogenic protein